MDMSQQIEAVYQRALLLRQYAVEAPVQQVLIEKSLQELYFVLEELQTSQEELHQTNQQLLATHQVVELGRKRYQTLFELAPNGYLVTDLRGVIDQANYIAASLFRTSPEFLVNKPLLVFIHEPDRPHFLAQLTRLTGQLWEVTLNPRDGTLITIQTAVSRIRDPLQGKEMLLWALHDITLRKQMEHQLQIAHNELELRVAERTAQLVQSNLRLQQEINERQQAEQRIRDQAALIDIATDAIFVQDLQHHILFWSKGAERLYGWAAADILGQPISMLFAPDGATQLTTGLTQTIEQGLWQAELNQITHTNSPIIVASRWTLVQDHNGQPQSILVVNTNITEQKRFEAQFYRAQRIETLGTLASGIAHDLNNILTPILGLAEFQLLYRQSMDEQNHEVWQVVQRSAQHGVNLVKQIALFAKGKSGERVSLYLGNLLLDVAKILDPTFPKSIQICTDISPETDGLILADPTQLHQVIMNLCVNARDAMPSGGTLTLASERRQVNVTQAQNHLEVNPGNYEVIIVSDTGMGIPVPLMEHIFEPFFTTKPPDQGTGLGLATVFSIVKNHGGFIELFSQEGKGTQFQVYFPAIADHRTQLTTTASVA